MMNKIVLTEGSLFCLLIFLC